LEKEEKDSKKKERKQSRRGGKKGSELCFGNTKVKEQSQTLNFTSYGEKGRGNQTE